MGSFALLSPPRPKARRLTPLKSFRSQGPEHLRQLPQQHGSRPAAPRRLPIRWARFGSLIKALREGWPAARVPPALSEPPPVVHPVVVISLVPQVAREVAPEVVLEAASEVVRGRPILRRLPSTSRG